MDVQGHRGCRGLMPENTIPAFIKALDLGVHTLEMDVVISKDHQVIVSHEPWMSYQFCTLPCGKSIRQVDEKMHNLYAMDYEQIRQYDCGSKYYAAFPDQACIASHKPSLEETFAAVEGWLHINNSPPIHYNIEMKVVEHHIGIFHPDRATFVDLVVAQIEKFGLREQVSLQCFDIATLQYLRKQYPGYTIVLLVENLAGHLTNVERLGFLPDIYSPYHQLVEPSLIAYTKARDIQVVTWTVNKIEDMQRLIDLGVDGIASDYPDRLLELIRQQ